MVQGARVELGAAGGTCARIGVVQGAGVELGVAVVGALAARPTFVVVDIFVLVGLAALAFAVFLSVGVLVAYYVRAGVVAVPVPAVTLVREASRRC